MRKIGFSSLRPEQGGFDSENAQYVEAVVAIRVHIEAHIEARIEAVVADCAFHM